MLEREGVTIVVTGADHATGLGTGRALKKIRNAGLKLIGLYKNRTTPFCQSHVWDELIEIRSEPAAFLEGLIEIGRSVSGARPVLLPTQDHAVKLISDNRTELGKCFQFVLPSRATVDVLMDKAAFYRWARLEGFLVPPSYIATSCDELWKILDEVEYPVVLKPGLRTAEWELKSPAEKVFKLTGKADARKIESDLIAVAGQFVVQQWVPGPDSNIYFCLVYIGREGKELGYYTGRKTVQWPIGRGSTAICIGTDEQDLYELTRRVFKKSGFIGLGSLEVKRSEQDGQYYILEPTVGRNDLQSFVAVAGGVNLSWLAVVDVIGRDSIVDSSEKRNSVWIDEYAAIQIFMDSGMKQLGWRHLIKTLGSSVSFAYFALADPMPFLNLMKTMLVRRFKRVYARMRSAMPFMGVGKA